jgi:hypothetical protein
MYFGMNIKSAFDEFNQAKWKFPVRSFDFDIWETAELASAGIIPFVSLSTKRMLLHKQCNNIKGKRFLSSLL